MSSERAAAVAAEYETALEQFIATVSRVPEPEWTRTTDSEGWPVGVTAHHVAVSVPFVIQLAEQVADGADITWTREFIDEVNAQHADIFGEADRAETLELLRENGADACRRLRLLDDTAFVTRAGTSMEYEPGKFLSTPEEICRQMLLHHTQEHLASIRSTLG
ncbi:MAG: DinB family protein [Candidatus Dormibacteria bacterium]